MLNGSTPTFCDSIAARAQRNVHIVDGVATDLERGPALVKPKAEEAKAS